MTPEQKVQAAFEAKDHDQALENVYLAARALCMTHDWNNGELGVAARKALMKAVNAVEELPNFKANLKTDVAS